MSEFSHPSMMDTLLLKQPLTIEHVERDIWCDADNFEIVISWIYHSSKAAYLLSCKLKHDQLTFVKSGIFMGWVGSHFSRWILKFHGSPVLCPSPFVPEPSM